MNRWAASLVVALSLAAPVAAGDLGLALPIDCELGKTCHIQQYVDRDPGPGSVDFRCGSLSYDGHKGTDIAVPTMADMRRGVNVLAAASGIVTGMRDEMPDTGATEATADDIEGRECGNGVVLRHDDGWETQYCHMKLGSVLVRKGDRVTTGTVLGQVGLSGRTQFPHVHLSVRHNGAVVDPFDPDDAGNDCVKGDNPLWDAPIAYRAGGLIDIGFYPGVPGYDAVRDGSANLAELAADASGLVIYGFAYGSQPGDVMTLTITAPDGRILITQDVTLDKAQAQFFRATGKRLTAARWPAGTYVGEVALTRKGEILDQRRTTMKIR